MNVRAGVTTESGHRLRNLEATRETDLKNAPFCDKQERTPQDPRTDAIHQPEANEVTMGFMKEGNSRQRSSDMDKLTWSSLRKDAGSLGEAFRDVRGPPIRQGQEPSPLTEKAMQAREQQNLEQYEERKAWRSARVANITKQWINSRTNKSGPKAEEHQWGSFDYLFCCCAR